MLVLMLGANGQLGKCFADNFRLSDYRVIYKTHDDLDITDFSLVERTIRDLNPDVIINACAYTQVDKAEQEKDLAALVNHYAVKNIAKVCGSTGCTFIHFSTDYVFDGELDRPYVEQDSPNPQGVYGESKLAGELSIIASGCKYIIIRTSWLFSEYGSNFLLTMLSLGSQREKLAIVNDQVGCPTYGQDLAKAVVGLLHRLDSNHKLSGLYHYGGFSVCSWYEFALLIFKEAVRQGIKTPKSVNSIGTSDYYTAAKRPKYSVLNSDKILNVFDGHKTELKSNIRKVLNKLG